MLDDTIADMRLTKLGITLAVDFVIDMAPNKQDRP